MMFFVDNVLLLASSVHEFNQLLVTTSLLVVTGAGLLSSVEVRAEPDEDQEDAMCRRVIVGI